LHLEAAVVNLISVIVFIIFIRFFTISLAKTEFAILQGFYFSSKINVTTGFHE
jgi:hypothetical protein